MANRPAWDRPAPEREHTEIEEELHEKAHIDYDRVAIVRTLSDLAAQTVTVADESARSPIRP